MKRVISTALVGLCMGISSCCTTAPPEEPPNLKFRSFETVKKGEKISEEKKPGVYLNNEDWKKLMNVLFELQRKLEQKE